MEAEVRDVQVHLRGAVNSGVETPAAYIAFLD